MKLFTKPNLMTSYLMLIVLLFITGCEEKKEKEISLADVITLPMEAIRQNVAKANGRVDSDGGANVTIRGFCYSVNSNPTIVDDTVHAGMGFGNFSANISGLTPATTYFLRAFAVNNAGVSYGNDLEFRTLDAVNLPSIQTSTITNIGKYAAFSGGTNISDGGGVITNKGIVWSRTGDPTIQNNEGIKDLGSGIDTFAVIVAGLLPQTMYYVRAFVHSNAGTSYGQQESFTTLPGDTTNIVTDIDGNVYPTVIVGRNRWMAENLRTTRYNDGTAIFGSLIKKVQNAVSEEMQANDEKKRTEYGLLYRVHTDTNIICPIGWRVPTSQDFHNMVSFLGGIDVAGTKLKSTTGWAHNGNGTDNYGFNAKPSGYIGSDGGFYNLGYNAYFWTCTDTVINRYGSRISRFIAHDFSQLGLGINESLTTFFSIRCVEE